MVELNLENFPAQNGFKIRFDDVPSHSNFGQSGDTSAPRNRRALGTNDMHISWAVGEEGDMIPWHTHLPDLYQAVIPYEGALRVSFLDNDGEEKVCEIGEREMMYLPSGAHNQVEFLESPTVMLTIHSEVTHPAQRVEHIVNADSATDTDQENVYDPKNVDHWGIEYDNLRGKIISIDEDSVEQI